MIHIFASSKFYDVSQFRKIIWATSVGSDGRESACNAGDEVRSLGWKDPLEKGMATTPVLFPGEFHGQRRLDSYIPWYHKDADRTEWLSLFNLWELMVNMIWPLGHIHFQRSFVYRASMSQTTSEGVDIGETVLKQIILPSESPLSSRDNRQ